MEDSTFLWNELDGWQRWPRKAESDDIIGLWSGTRQKESLWRFTKTITARYTHTHTHTHTHNYIKLKQRTLNSYTTDALNWLNVGPTAAHTSKSTKPQGNPLQGDQNDSNCSNIKGIYPKSDIFSHYLFSLMSFELFFSVKHEDILINVF